MKLRTLFSVIFALLAGCSDPREESGERVHFSVLVPKPAAGQSTRFVEGVKVMSSTLPRSTVSAMVINNPIRENKEAIIALAIRNEGNETLSLAWERIVFFHPKNVIRMLPPDNICDYFDEPGHSKPVLGSGLFRRQMEEAGALGENDAPAEQNLLPTESRLAEIYRNIRKDLCFVKLPRNETLAPGKVTAGFLVIVLPEKHFRRTDMFMLKIPVDGDLHKLRYALRPLQ